MRIGMILDKIFPPDPRVENEATFLANNGFEVFLFCLTYDAKNPLVEEVNGVKIRRYKTNKLTYKLSALAYTFPFYKWIMRRKIFNFIKKNKIDVVHVHDLTIAGSVFSSIKNNKLPIVLDLHDNLPEIMKFYPHVQKFPGKWLINPKKWKQAEEKFLHKADEIITVSEEFKKEILKRLKVDDERIKVVPNTVSQDFYLNHVIDQPLLNTYAKDYVILYVGDTGIRRGLLTAINAIPLLKDKIPNVKLVIVGANTEDEILKQRVKDLEVTKFVDFQGWQDVKLFPSYIQACAVGISPLYRNIQHDVAYPNKLFQYMSFAKPVLVSDATAQKNIVLKRDAGWIHKEKDERDFASKIITSYTDQESSIKKGLNGRDFVQNEFSWEKTALELVKLYNSLKS